MDLLVLSKNILSKKSKKLKISSSDFPSKIYFDSQINSKLKQIKSYTDKSLEGFRTGGSAGWEYAFNVYFFHNILISSEPISGNYSSVKISQGFGFNSTYSTDRKYLNFTLKIGEKEKKLSPIKSDEVLNGKLVYGKVATFHTHPRYYHNNEVYQYTFFSQQDISSLIYGSAFIQGMIMGSNIWLACKSDNPINADFSLLHQASRIEIREGYKNIRPFVSKNMNNMGIIFYEGSLGSSLTRVA